MTAMRLSAFIESVGVVGPGLANWPQTADVLAARMPYANARTVLPPPDGLPAAERRRTGPVVKTALAVGHEAVAASGRDATTLAAVFAASGGDGVNCHAICATLAGDDRQLSPTRFHNSVHNAPAGYWSIAAHAQATSNGRHGSRESSSSELKPYSVVKQSESTPPTTAASMSPASIMRRADPNTFALDEQAEEIDVAGPRRPKYARTKEASANGLCVCA